MATITEFLFEGGADDGWTSFSGTHLTIDTVEFYEGDQSIYIDAVGATRQHLYGSIGSVRTVTGRFYYRLKTDASGTGTMIQLDNTSGSGQLQLRAGRKLRCTFVGGTASADSSVLNLNQWYLIDFLCRTDSGTSTFAYKIDGVDQTGASRVQTAADQPTLRLGVNGATTFQVNVDALKLTDQVGDYPLGALPVIAGGFPYVGAGYYPA